MLLTQALSNPNKEKLLEEFWKSILEEEDELIEGIDILYQLICVIANMDLLISLGRNKYLKDPEEKKENEKARADYFRSFLYEKKKIEKS